MRGVDDADAPQTRDCSNLRVWNGPGSIKRVYARLRRDNIASLWVLPRQRPRRRWICICARNGTSGCVPIFTIAGKSSRISASRWSGSSAN